MQQLAEAEAVRSGQPDDRGLARLGASGHSIQNVERDFHRRVRHGLQVPLLHLTLPAVERVTQQPINLKWVVMPPHRLFRHMVQKGLLNKLRTAGAPTPGEFWRACAGEAWARDHPVYKLAPDVFEQCWPLRIFADEGRGRKKEPLWIITWSSPLAHGPSWDTRFVFCVFPQKRAFYVGEKKTSP